VEGKEYWGDEPPFSPSAFPAGSFYQRDGGERGHELGAAEATPEVVEHLRSELPAGERRALALKNPYNTVRVPWLRAAFPEAYLVGIVRRPLPTSSTHGSVWDSSGPRSTQSRKQVNAGAARIEWASGAQTPARATIAWRPSPSSGSPWANRRSPKSSSSRRSNASRSPALTSSGSSPSSPSETNRGISS
jgi:hypothetical protein